jgi:hypothetical protein
MFYHKGIETKLQGTHNTIKRNRRNAEGKSMKPRELKPSIKRLIFHEAIQHRNIPREVLANRLIREIKKSSELPPTLETTKRYISKARNAVDPIDKPWTLGACRDYPSFFPPSSLLLLMKMQQESKTFVNILTNIRSPGLSIRTCMWIVRLQPLIKEYFRSDEDDFQQQYEILFNVAQAYSTAERTSEIMGEQAFDTSDLDESVCSQNLENILLFGFSGFKNTSSICEGDCESCKYVPVIKGKLCQLKVIRREQKRLKKQMTEQGLIDPNEEGD